MKKLLVTGLIVGLLVAIGTPMAGWVIYGNIQPQAVTPNMIWAFVVCGIGFATFVVCGIIYESKYH